MQRQLGTPSCANDISMQKPFLEFLLTGPRMETSGTDLKPNSRWTQSLPADPQRRSADLADP